MKESYHTHSPVIVSHARSQRQRFRFAADAVLTMLLASCSGLNTSRLLPSHAPDGSHRLVQLMRFVPRSEILPGLGGEHRRILEASGLPDAQITDRSIGMGQVFCCGGGISAESAVSFYIPPHVHAERGDAVEVRCGVAPRGGDPGRANVAVRVRQKGDTVGGPVRWMPGDERLWRRILYADWMPQEGWVEQKGMWHTWIKPAP